MPIQRHPLRSIVIAAAAGCAALSVGFARTAVAARLQETQPAAPTTQPATAAGAVEQLEVTVTGVEGLVQVRPAEDQPWQRAAVGMTLSQDAEFRTGPRSAVRFVLAPDQTITLDRLGTVKVLQAINDGGRIKTNLGMKYGRTRYDIEAAGREHESTISSPSSTLAVRGTEFSLTDERPFPPLAVSRVGRVDFRQGRKQTAFGGPNRGKLAVEAGDNSPAETALGSSYVDPAGATAARSGNESRLIASLAYSGARVSYDYDKGIPVVRGGRVPLTDGALIPTLPGTLNFVLRWVGNADLNLGVISPRPAGSTANATVYPLGGVNIVRSGGQTSFDHRGGANGGIEVVFWTAKPPDGVYAVGVQHMSGPSVDAVVDVFLNGERVSIITSQGRVTTSRLRAAPLPPGSDISGQLAGSVRIFNGVSPGGSTSVPTGRAAGVTRATPAKAPAAAAAPPPRLVEKKRR